MSTVVLGSKAVVPGTIQERDVAICNYPLVK